MTAHGRRRGVSLQIAIIVIGLAALFVGFSEGRHASPGIAGPTTVNLGRKCYSVVDFGADPSGAVDSTSEIQSALISASQQNGVGVCAPAGTYKISGDLTLYTGATSGTSLGGPSFYGAGPGLTVLATSSTGNVFDSCPSYANVTPGFAPPTPCPVLSMYPGGTANANSTLTGVVLANFSITHSVVPATGADFVFPSVNGMLVDNVCVSNARNVFDLGQHTMTQSFSSITIKDSTCGFSYTGHFVALHGAGSGLAVDNNQISGPGIVLDTSDLTNGNGAPGSVSGMTWSGNVIEQPLIGMFNFAPGSASTAGTAITSSQWTGNVYDGCVLVCYYFGADPLSVLAPTFGSLRVSDRAASSRYDSLYFDGAFFAPPGVGGVQVGGPSFYSGSSGGTAGSLIMLRGTPAPNDQIWIVWNPAGSTPYYSYHLVGSSDTPNAIASALAATAIASPIARQVNLANSGYGLIGVSMMSTPAAGSYSAQPYKVIINSSGLTAAGIPTAGARCTAPPAAGSPGHFPCWTGAFDVGDAAAIRDGAHDIDIKGSRLSSQAGAAIHVWQAGGDQFHFLNNVLGSDGGVNSYTGLQFDAGPTNPVNYYTSSNDFVGSTNPIVSSLPTPSFVGTGAAPAMRANRGGLALITSGTALPISNAGPYDCVYYISWVTSGTVNYYLTLPQVMSATSLGATAPTQVFLPVGATFTATPVGTGSAAATYSGFCQP